MKSTVEEYTPLAIHCRKMMRHQNSKLIVLFCNVQEGIVIGADNGFDLGDKWTSNNLEYIEKNFTHFHGKVTLESE